MNEIKLAVRDALEESFRMAHRDVIEQDKMLMSFVPCLPPEGGQAHYVFAPRKPTIRNRFTLNAWPWITIRWGEGLSDAVRMDRCSLLVLLQGSDPIAWQRICERARVIPVILCFLRGALIPELEDPAIRQEQSIADHDRSCIASAEVLMLAKTVNAVPNRAARSNLSTSRRRLYRA
jgi:hypothetical protein